MENTETAKTPSVKTSLGENKFKLFLKQRGKIILIVLVCLIFIVLVFALVIFSFLNSNKKPSLQRNTWPNVINENVPAQTAQPVATLASTPTPTPKPRPLPSGPQQYSVSSRNNPEVKMLNISSLNTKIGDLQKMSITVSGSQSPVVSVTVKLITDNKSENHTLTLASGSNTTGVWEGTWNSNDTHDFNYQAVFVVKYEKGNDYSFTASFR